MSSRGSRKVRLCLARASLFPPHLTLIFLLVGFAMSCGVETVESRQEYVPVSREHRGLDVSRDSSKKLALIVAIGDYARSSGWHDLSAENDLALIRSVLIRQGFSEQHIHAVHGKKVNKRRILDAFKNSLIKQAAPGDTVLFHYSGHGHRITDDNHDEIDGYDEVLVPYDAPRWPAADYKGDKHIRDDELNSLITALRARVGVDGDVFVSMDSCNSGTGIRGEGRGTSRVRGAIEPIGRPQRTPGRSLGPDSGSGFIDAESAARGGSADTVQDIAPYVVFSAAPYNMLAYETTDSNGEPIGSLTLALGSALSSASGNDTYRAIFQRVKTHMAARVRNVPQAEGDVDRELFGGKAVAQAPYFPVTQVHKTGTKVKLGAGNLVGLLPGTIVELYPAGTREPTTPSRLAKGEVESSCPMYAIVALDRAASPESLGEAWAFVTEPAFGDVKVRVQVDAQNHDWADKLARKLRTSKFVDIVSKSPDLRVQQTNNKVIVERARDALPLLEDASMSNPSLEQEIVERLEDFARNRYLRKLKLESPRFNVRFEVMPCELKCETDEFSTTASRCECVEDLRVVTKVSKGNPLTFSVGDGFRIRLTNTGPASAYVTILDLMPDGRIGLLWPPFGTPSDDTLLRKEQVFDIPSPYGIEPPVGTDIFKLFASREPIEELQHITSNWRRRGGPRGAPRGPLDKLFKDTLDLKRGGNPRILLGSVSTFSIPIQISEPAN
jgi:hypothetical protein